MILNNHCYLSTPLKTQPMRIIPMLLIKPLWYRNYFYTTRSLTYKPKYSNILILLATFIVVHKILLKLKKCVPGNINVLDNARLLCREFDSLTYVWDDKKNATNSTDQVKIFVEFMSYNALHSNMHIIEKVYYCWIF